MLFQEWQTAQLDACFPWLPRNEHLLQRSPLNQIEGLDEPTVEPDDVPGPETDVKRTSKKESP